MLLALSSKARRIAKLSMTDAYDKEDTNLTIGWAYVWSTSEIYESRSKVFRFDFLSLILYLLVERL